MERPHLTPVTIADFLRWKEAGDLILSPKFQHRRIWPSKAKSYLIDTILSGFPVPKLYMRQHLQPKKLKTAREVVDGQQRLTTVIDFFENRLRLAKAHGAYGGSTFEDLDPSVQKRFLSYEFSVDMLIDASDADVLNVFGRINSYSVPLNAQEKRNAKFFGEFKQTVYNLGYEHLESWKGHKILSDRAIARMREAELTSELLIAMVDGLQDKKTSINKFYELWDDKFPHQPTTVARFREIVDAIESLVGDTLEKTAFRRAALFYSLFLAIYALRYGMDGTPAEPRAVRASHSGSVKRSLLTLSKVVDAAERPRKLLRSVEACQRQTDNIRPRRIRHNTIVSAIRNA